MSEDTWGFLLLQTHIPILLHSVHDNSQVSNIESDDSQNVGLEDYNNISDEIFPCFTTPSIETTLG